MTDYYRDHYADEPAPSLTAALGESVRDAAHEVLATSLRLIGAAGETAVHQVASQPVVERYPGNIVA